MGFTMTGKLDDGREASISWFPIGPERYRARPTNRRGLVGDEDVIRRAIIDEVEGRTFRATRTGPYFLADLDNAEAALVQLISYFADGYSLDGDPPTIDASVPTGAIP